MNHIIELLQCRKAGKQSQSVRAGIVISAAIAVASAVSGTVAGLWDHRDESAGFWGWLVNGPAAEAPHFITDDTQTRLVDLRGEWRFATGDDPARARAGFDAADWTTIDVPAYWEDEGYENYDGYAWYRREFTVTAEPTGPLYIRTGRIDDVDEVFINGRRVGGTGRFPPGDVSAWDRERVYRIPPGLVRPGANIVAIRVYDAEQGGGIQGRTIGLYTTTLPQPLIELTGPWRFKTGNNPDWKNETADDAEFESIDVPFEWEPYGHAGYDGHAWYRKQFGRLAVPADETLVLLLGKIDDTDAVYLNGIRIGQTGNPDDPGGNQNEPFYRMKREYEFSASLLKDTNTLAVHVYDGQGRGGIYSGPVGIMTKNDHAARKKQIEQADKWRLDDTIDWLLGRE